VIGTHFDVDARAFGSLWILTQYCDESINAAIIYGYHFFFLLPPQVTPEPLDSTPRQVSRAKNSKLVRSNSRRFAGRDTPQRLGLAADMESPKGPEVTGSRETKGGGTCDCAACIDLASVLPQVWQDKVYPLLKSHLAEYVDSVSSYMLLYHGATLANLLEVGPSDSLPPIDPPQYLHLRLI
jgi:hypothetical protein